jgi:hypothetical protein
MKRAAALMLCALEGLAQAQGGPPLVTDDPDTPGDGHWEINIAAIGSRATGGTQWNAPDADINYGWGDHLQLKVDLPWTTVQTPGTAHASGPGYGNFGIKWRFLDASDEGWSVSTYPQVATALAASSVSRGLAPAGHSVFLPLEFATRLGGFGFDAEVGRNFSRPNQWMAGAVLAHGCGGEVECLFEIHETVGEPANQLLLNLGLRWKINDAWTLLTSAGREFGPANLQQQRALVYLGLQTTR